MLRDGRYAAWFRTSRGEGTCIVQLADGRISGGDSFFTYAGSYEADDDRFTAVLATKRHAEGPPTVFGLDEVEIKLEGKIKGTTAACTGTAEQAPGVKFEATLFLGQEQAPEPARKRPAPTLKAGKLPKASDSRYKARNPFARGPSTV
jgi:hypothetical protein